MFRMPRLGASPQMAEAAVNRMVPRMNARRRPLRSARVAADMMNMPMVRL